MKILIIRFSSIGDIVLTTPVIRCLKNQLQNVEIHYLTKMNFVEIIENNPNIDKIWTLDDSLLTTLNYIKSQKFDLIIDLHNNLRTLIFKIFCNTKTVSFEKLNFKKYLLVNFKINLLPKIHIVDRYLNTVKHLGIINDNCGLDYFFPKQMQIIKNNILEKTGSEFICIAIGGQHNTKKLPSEKLKELFESISSKIVLIGGKDDMEVASDIEKTFRSKVINYAGKLSVNESAILISLCKVLITHDTGMMHIAAAIKKPIIAIWGNTVPVFGMYPYYGSNQVFYQNFEVRNLKCRPCSKIGFEICPKKHFKCMRLQDVAAISKAALSIK